MRPVTLDAETLRRAQRRGVVYAKHGTPGDPDYPHGDGGGGGDVKDDAYWAEQDAKHERESSLAFAVAQAEHGLDRYVQLGSEWINPALRSGKQLKGDARETVERMDMAFPLLGKDTARDMALYKGVSSVKLEGALSRGEIGSGSTIVDPAFFSTTKSENIATRFAKEGEGVVVFRLDVPKGMRYVPGREDERELIFPRGSRVRVSQVSGDRRAGFTVRGKLLAPERPLMTIEDVIEAVNG